MRLSRKAAGVALVGLVVAGVLTLLAIGLMNREPVTGMSGFTRVGKPAPDFRMPLFNGGQLELSQHLNKPLVINFWASWCPPCWEEAPILEAAWRAYRDSGVLFVGVDIQDSEGDARDYLEEFDVTYPNGRDGDGRITVEYGVIGLPVTFFVDRNGVVQRRWVGAIREGRLKAWVDELVAGVSPTGETEGENPEGFFELE